MDVFEAQKVIEIQGNPIAYYRAGDGEVVLFIHGIATYSFIWKKVVPYFKDKYDVVLIDLLGCGDSAKPLNQDFSLKRQAHLLKDFCDRLEIARLHLVCHDVGGGVGQIFAVNYPELLYDLVLVNSVAYNFWPVQPIVALRTPIIRQIAMASLDYGMFELIVKRGLYNKKHFSDEFMDFFYRPMKTSAGRKAFLHFARCLDNKNLTEIENELRQLKIPVLIIRGRGDVYLDALISVKLHSEIPNSKLIEIETAGHFIQEEEPEQLSAVIITFIQKE